MGEIWRRNGIWVALLPIGLAMNILIEVETRRAWSCRGGDDDRQVDSDGSYVFYGEDDE